MEAGHSPMADGPNKEADISSVNSTNTSGRNPEWEGPPLMVEKDLESCRVAEEVPQDTEFSGTDPAIRVVSTKSSWKDPGPPPDGGLIAWSQGAYSPMFVYADSGPVYDLK
jgi:hypothetical protein